MEVVRENLTNFVWTIIDDVKEIYLPTVLGLTALYLPVFLLALLKHSILKISKWFLTIPIVVYLLLVPTCQSIRVLPLLNTCIAGIAIYYAQKVCEWILIRRDEFSQWTFFDIHHELFYYRVYTQPVKVKKLNPRKKEIFFTGSIQYMKHFTSLIYISLNIIRYYALLDLFIHILNEIFSTDLYEKSLFIRILVNQASGWMVYLFITLIYEISRHILCLIFNRPLELIPDLFRQPYQATSPIDFWSRWHQM